MNKYINLKDVGECDINVECVIKKFTLLHRIFLFHNEYYLMEYTPKCKRRMKIRIKETDAKKIIERLHLKPIRDDLFINAITYVPVG